MIDLADEQVEAVGKYLGLYLPPYGIKETVIKEALTDTLTSLTTDQIKQIAELKSGYFGEWLEFDIGEEITWPDTEHTNTFVTNIGSLIFNNGEWLTLSADSNCMNRPVHGVTHYTTLPEFKGG